MSILVLVADGSRARLLRVEIGSSELTETGDFIHPEGRLREQELVSDDTGRGQGSAGQGRHAMGHEKEAHHRQQEIFAQELCREIDRLRNRGDLHRIYLIAPPAFLGHLRGALGKQSAKLIAGEIDKNLVTSSLEDIRAHLPKRM